jgi:hypothetical protein
MVVATTRNQKGRSPPALPSDVGYVPGPIEDAGEEEAAPDTDRTGGAGAVDLASDTGPTEPGADGTNPNESSVGRRDPET